MRINIQRLKNRDETSFRECVEAYKDTVINTIFQFIRNRDDVEDLVYFQESQK